MMVVNSFHFGIFTEAITTFNIYISVCSWLWIPFISVFLLKQLQPIWVSINSYNGCEFLSFRYFYWSNYNISGLSPSVANVVISFHFGIFTEAITTYNVLWPRSRMLWIPFISVFLLKQLQRESIYKKNLKSCEFLSFRYFYWSNYNGNDA